LRIRNTSTYAPVSCNQPPSPPGIEAAWYLVPFEFCSTNWACHSTSFYHNLYNFFLFILYSCVYSLVSPFGDPYHFLLTFRLCFKCFYKYPAVSLKSLSFTSSFTMLFVLFHLKLVQLLLKAFLSALFFEVYTCLFLLFHRIQLTIYLWRSCASKVPKKVCIMSGCLGIVLK
jgi:hypothetical protein